MMEDNKIFGEDIWIHCDSHGRAHKTGWCTVSPKKKTRLNYQGDDYRIAYQECRDRGLWLFMDEEQKRKNDVE